MRISYDFSPLPSVSELRAEALRRGLTLPTKRTAPGQNSAPIWTPQDGPQTHAYQSEADVIGYGGAAGGGKSDLLLGLAGLRHQRSIIFRRVFPSLRGLIERSREIFNQQDVSHARDSFNEQLHLWRLASGRLIEFGSAQHEADLKKYQGQPHDFLAFDEVTEFPEKFVRFLSAWNRTTVTGQKCQIAMTFNPPMDEEGEWVTRYFGPWLDPQHPRPAVDGELRWYAMVDGKEVERENGAPFEHKDKTITPRSRTFFHATLDDNPALSETGYGATIDALPEPLRSLLKGHFDAAKSVNPWQVIPTDWVKAAQARWTPEKPEAPMTAVGVDLVRGGNDKLVIACLHDNWCAPLIEYPGAAIPDGPTAAALIVSVVEPGAQIAVDVVGIGASGYDSLTHSGVPAMAVNNAESAGDQRDRSGRLKFRNVRAASYWKLREALDPQLGDGIALPPDPELLSDLCAPRFSLTTGGVLLESKDDIKARLGRSPDKGDAVVMAHWSALNSISDLIAW